MIGGILAVLMGLLIVVGVFAYKSGLLEKGVEKTEQFKAKALRTEAKMILSSARINLIADYAESGKYSDLVDRVFLPGMFHCENTRTCYNYVYALQAACERGGAWQVPSNLKPLLNPPVAERFDEIVEKMKSLNIPCKSKETGFHLLAIGIVSPPHIDAVLMTDQNNELKILMDSAGF